MSTRLDRSTRTLTTEPRRGAQELRRAQGWGGHERRRAVSEPGLPPPARARGGTPEAVPTRVPPRSCPPPPPPTALAEDPHGSDARVLDHRVTQQLLAHGLDLRTHGVLVVAFDLELEMFAHA